MNDPSDMLKITLSRAALERLIGNDPHMEMLLSHNAVKTVIDRHLDLLVTKVVDQLNRVTEPVLDNAVKNIIGVVSRKANTDVYAPAEHMILAIRNVIEPYVHKRLQEIVSERMESIDTRITEIAEHYASNVIDKKIKEAMAMAMAALNIESPK